MSETTPLQAVFLTPTGQAADALISGAAPPALSAEQTTIVDRILDRGDHEHMLVQGGAGTGKSAILQTVRRQTLSEVQTIDRMCASKVGASAADWLMSVRSNSKLHLPTTHLIILDEFYMVSALHFNKLCSLFKALKDPKKPFGGCRVIMVGDCCQLPPVGDRSLFETKVYEEMAPRIHRLTEFHRFSASDERDRAVFLELLQELSTFFLNPRPLTSSAAATLDYCLCEPSRTRPPSKSAVYLFATNEERAAHNRTAAKRWGSPHQVVLVSSDVKEAPLANGVALFPGAPVVIRRNVYDKDRLLVANGASCEFVEILGAATEVLTVDGIQYTVFTAGPKVELVVTDRGKRKVVPSVEKRTGSAPPAGVKRRKKVFQWPCDAGFGRTIHSVQGATLTGRVHVDFGSVRFVEGSQHQLIYVAFSRVREMGQLTCSGLDSGVLAAVAKKLSTETTSFSAVKKVLGYA